MKKNKLQSLLAIIIIGTIILIMLVPLLVKADELKVVSHLIDAEIEIAGALNVKELIVVEGEATSLQRTLNYYSFGSNAWDKKTVKFDNGTIYNGYSISLNSVAAYELTDKAEFGSFDKNVKEYFKELDIKNPSDNTYTFKDKKDGTAILTMFYPVKNKKIAFYINYVISNVVVNHNDIKEINYTFKNLNYKANETYLRVLIPYQTDNEQYHVWVHGNKSGEVQELVNESGLKAGIIAKFPKVKESINFRMTLPSDQVGLDIYLNKSNTDALNEVILLEEAKLNQTIRSDKIINIMSYVLIVLGIIYALASLIFLKLNIKIIYILYLALGLFIMLFNYLFKFNYWYLYLIILFPVSIKLIKKYIVK